MIERKDVKKLAALARITIPENEMEKVQKDIGAILGFVDQINEAKDIATQKGHDKEKVEDIYASGVKNVMREDGMPHESGEFTDILLEGVPKKERGYIKVKKIL